MATEAGQTAGLSAREIRIRDDSAEREEEGSSGGGAETVEGRKGAKFFLSLRGGRSEESGRRGGGVKFISLMEQGISRLTTPATKQPSSTPAGLTLPGLTPPLELRAGAGTTFGQPICRLFPNSSKIVGQGDVGLLAGDLDCLACVVFR